MMLSGKNQLSPVPDDLRVIFRRPPLPFGVPNGDFADSNAIRIDQFATEPEKANAISEGAIRDELLRILGSPMFIQSDRLRRFLQFTVNMTLKGEGEMLKEYLIGTEVYGRPTSYQPSEDSIVRSEARRLRSKLKEYYASVGRNDPVVIEYSPGSYVPMFRNNKKRGSKITARDPTPRPRFRRRHGIRIAVLPFLDAPGGSCCGVYAQLITDELIHELARTDGILVTAASSVAPLVAKGIDVRTLARKLGVQIVFEGTVRQDDNMLRITSRVVDPADGFQVWSDRIDTEPTLQGLPTVIAKFASSLVDHIQA